VLTRKLKGPAERVEILKSIMRGLKNVLVRVEPNCDVLPAPCPFNEMIEFIVEMPGMVAIDRLIFPPSMPERFRVKSSREVLGGCGLGSFVFIPPSMQLGGAFNITSLFKSKIC
jgi:hypothetical protein